LIALAASLVGHLRGGLGQINVLSSLFFGGVSGSAIADVSAIGGAMIPQMVSRGFDRDFAVSVTVSSAIVALLIPPSHNLILYSASAAAESPSPTCSPQASFRAAVDCGPDDHRRSHGTPSQLRS